VRSLAGISYDVLRFVHPSLYVPHNGLKFSAFPVDYDTHPGSCAIVYGGGWWYNTCGSFIPHSSPVPTFYSPPDNNWYAMLNVHMMVKLQ